MLKAPLHVVLFEPEIPPNTGNIARLCACTGCQLHLVHPLGFDLSDKQVRRAGLDYWPHLNVKEHDNGDAVVKYFADNLEDEPRYFGLTTKTKASLWDAAYLPNDILVMGPETRGLPAEILAQINPITIPMRDDAPIRSLNLSSPCSVVVYEALRQINR